MMISEHNQIDKKLSNKEIGSPISGLFGLTPHIQLSKTSKKIEHGKD